MAPATVATVARPSAARQAGRAAVRVQCASLRERAAQTAAAVALALTLAGGGAHCRRRRRASARAVFARTPACSACRTCCQLMKPVADTCL